MIIDIGCGIGNNSIPYLKHHEVIGVDIDKENIAICKKNYPNARWEVGDITTYDFSQFQDVDLAICKEVVEHVVDWKAVIRNISRLPKGTHLVLTVPHQESEKKLLKIHPGYWNDIGHLNFFSGEELKNMLEEHGWTGVKVKRANAALYFELKSLFKKKAPCIRNTYYENILPLPQRLFYQLFRKDLFQTKLKYFFPVWMITLPVAFLIDKWWGATIEIRATKK